MKILLTAVCTAFALLPCTAYKNTGEQYMLNENEVSQINVELTDSAGNLHLRWEAPSQDTSVLYTVTAVSADNGSTEDLYHLDTNDTYMNVSEVSAFVCQEYGFRRELCFRVDAKIRDQIIASGTSTSFDPSLYFPEKEELMIGTDISPEEITGFDWKGSGMMANDYFCYSFTLEDALHLYADWYDDNSDRKETDKNLPASDRTQLIEFLKNGKLVRTRIFDPSFVVLDGSSQTMSVTWNSMEEKDRYYEFEPASPVEFEHWIRDAAETSDTVRYGPYIAIASSAVLGLVLLAHRFFTSGKQK